MLLECRRLELIPLLKEYGTTADQRQSWAHGWGWRSISRFKHLLYAGVRFQLNGADCYVETEEFENAVQACAAILAKGWKSSRGAGWGRFIGTSDTSLS